MVVPTPIDQAHRPDLSPLEGASRTVALHMRPGTTVIYDLPSTRVAPRKCVSPVESGSGLQWRAGG